MKDLFTLMEDFLVGWATGTKDQLIESGDMGQEDAMIRQWGERWLRVFRRKIAVEDAWVRIMLSDFDSTKQDV